MEFSGNAMFVYIALAILTLMLGTIGFNYLKIFLQKLVEDEVKKQANLEIKIKAEKLKQSNSQPPEPQLISPELPVKEPRPIPHPPLPSQESLQNSKEEDVKLDPGFIQSQEKQILFRKESNFYPPQAGTQKLPVRQPRSANSKWKQLGLAAILGFLIFTILLSPSLRSFTGKNSKSNYVAESMSVNLPNVPSAPKTVKPTLDYTNLTEFLEQKDWQAADRETYELVLKIAGEKSQSRGYIDYSEIDRLPCAELKKIDRIWREASQGKLGFSAQQIMYKGQGQDWQKMYSKIQWGSLKGKNFVRLVDKDLNLQNRKLLYKDGMEPNFENPPVGHLPVTIKWVRGKEFPQFAELCEF